MSAMRNAVLALAVGLLSTLANGADKKKKPVVSEVAPVSVEVTAVKLNTAVSKLQVSFNVTANEAFTQGAVILSAQSICFDGDSEERGSGGYRLDSMKKGERKLVETFLVGIETQDVPRWCEVTFAYASGGKEFATKCWHATDRDASDGKCRRQVEQD